MGVDQLPIPSARIRHRTGQQLVEGRAEGVDIGSVVGHRAEETFRRDIVRGVLTHTRPGESGSVVEAARDAEIGDQCALAAIDGGDEQIGRLDVAMHDIVAMGVVEPRGGIAEDAGRPFRVEPARFAGQQLGGIRAVDVLHFDPADAVCLAPVQDPDDVVVGERAGQVGFPAEQMDVAPARLRRVEHLQRHRFGQTGMRGAVDRPHPTGAEFFLDPVIGERFTQPQYHVVVP
nr:hypothetical protein [Nocardia cyriacigeorgica]